MDYERSKLIAEYRDDIEKDLRKYLDGASAAATANKIYVVALEIEEIISRLWNDPEIRRVYDYDGRLFTDRTKKHIFRAFDGLNLMNLYHGDALKSYFGHLGPSVALDALYESLETNFFIVKFRLLNWETCGTIAFITPQMFSEIYRKHGHGLAKILLAAEGNYSPLSAEENSFFAGYEKQLKNI